MGGVAGSFVTDQTPHAEPLGPLPRRVRTQRHRQRHRRPLGCGCRRDEPHGLGARFGSRRQEPHQEQVDAVGGVRTDALSAPARRRCRRKRPGGTHHAVAARAAQPHRVTRDRRPPRRGRRPLRKSVAYRTRQQRPDLSHAPGPDSPALQVPRRRHRHDGRQFRRGGSRGVRRLHQRGQRGPRHFVPRPAHRHHGARKGDPRLPGARRLHPPAGPLGHRTARNGLHLALPTSRTGQTDPRHHRR